MTKGPDFDNDKIGAIRHCRKVAEDFWNNHLVDDDPVNACTITTYLVHMALLTLYGVQGYDNAIDILAENLRAAPRTMPPVRKDRLAS